MVGWTFLENTSNETDQGMGIPATEPKRSPWRAALLAVPLALAVGGWLAYPKLEEYLESRPDRGDFQGNPELLVRMQSAALPAQSPGAASNDWPQWRGPRRDGVAADTGLLAAW